MLRPFHRKFLNSLSLQDQELFESYGQGPAVQVPHALIHEAFAEMAEKYPDLIAATYAGESLSYRELDEQSDRLASYLAELGVKPQDHVGLFLQRSLSMVVGILAILKTGAAYVPQDARVTPASQLQHIIKTASTKVILTLSDLQHLIPIPNGHICLSIDDFLKSPSQPQKKFRRPQIKSESTCFVLFTSGTTGMPNGVQVTHKNVCNILLTEPGRLGMRPGLKVSQILNISFDMAAWEILGALSHGSTLAIRGKDIQETLEQVDIVIATPSILGSLNADRCQKVKFVAVAGEPCPKPLADRWSQFATFYNSCGPTEVTIVNTMQNYNLSKGQLSIGKPTPNNTVYILNEDLSPCAIGEIGEMWAGGDCVSKAYIQNNELNKERYRPDPFLGGKNRMFRTRDLGRWTKTGELEHFGRTDDQVKIRGFRVELDSVSKALESVHFCKQAVTLKLDSRHLAAFVRPRSVNLKAALKAVENALPYYCVPNVIIALDEFPTTSRGKIDKRALTIMAVEEKERREKMKTAGSEAQVQL